MTESITLRQHIDAPPDKVFETLTSTAAVETWLAEHADIDLEDSRFEFWGRFSPDGERGRQQLLTADPARSLRFAWTIGAATTEVQIELEPDDSATRLTLTQSGLPPRVGAEHSTRDWWLLSLDNLASFVEGRSVGPRVDFSTLNSREARVEAELDASPEDVYAALIEPAQLERWIALRATVEPEVGGRYDFGWDHGPVKILELEPARRLMYSWAWHTEGGPDTVVSWELEGSGGKTHLTLVHAGFVPDGSAEGYTVGWTAFVTSLKRMVELGEAWKRIEELQPTSA